VNLFVQFSVSLLILYLGYYILVIRNVKHYDSRRIPKEVEFMINVYKLKIDKINYRILLHLIALTNSFIISLTTICVRAVDNMLLKLVFGFFLLIFLIISCYSLIGYYFKKKGLTKSV